MLNKDHIKDWLGRGLKPSRVAAMVGCTESYISQLLGDETFSSEVEALKLQQQTKSLERENKIDSIVDKSLDKLSEALDFSPSIAETCKILQTVAATRTNLEAAKVISNSEGLDKLVVINLPQVIADRLMPQIPAAQDIVVNQNGEVIKVGNRELVTMSTPQFEELAKIEFERQQYANETANLLASEDSLI